MPRRLALAGLALAALTPAAAAADAAKVDRAVQIAAELLLEAQEAYVPDPPVGTLPEKTLPEWQREERVRLDAMVAAQPVNARREWPYEGVYRVGPDGRIPPGYRVGGTAIVCAALVQTPGFAQMDDRRDAVARGLAFVLDELDSNPLLGAGPKQGYDVRGWAHAYALDLLLLLRREGHAGDGEERIERTIPDLIDRIAAAETSRGGWNYAGDSISPFMTGSTLLALYAARAQGFDVDAAMVGRALDGLERGRTTLGAFRYAGPARGEVAMPGSAARAAIAELALLRAGRSDADRLADAVDGFFGGWDDLHHRKSRQGTHEGPFGIAPYYFFFGHAYAARAIEALPADERPGRRERLRALLWRTREPDGGWNDRIFPRTRSCSTAMAALALLAPRLHPVPPWPASREAK